MTKMGNIVPRAELEPIFLACQVGVLTITTPRLPNVITLTASTCLYGSLSDRSVQMTILIPLEL